MYHAGHLDRPRSQLPLRFSGKLFELVYSPSRRLDSESGTSSGKECRPVSPLFLAHFIAISDVLVAVEAACRKRGMTYVANPGAFDKSAPAPGQHRPSWRISFRIESKASQLSVSPDASFTILPRGSPAGVPLHFFLEMDRGTMPIRRSSLRLSSIYRKALAYRETKRSRVLSRRYGIRGFQVLFVSTSKARLERIKDACRSVDGRTSSPLFLFAALDNIKNESSRAEFLLNDVLSAERRWPRQPAE